ncbi:MAG TPA: DUF423 domain-containing protein [Xanthobacteraceae bacterium]|nr:DUF423 domain-containing protein [Xanthobacteraceae bacterium]
MAVKILLALAGVMGAAGMVLAAAAAHVAPGTALDGAAYMLLFHAVAVIGGVALLQQNTLQRPPALLVLAAWVIGAALFASDIAMRTFAGHRLFPFAAPTGGTILIAAWLTFMGTAVCALVRK